MALPSTPGGAKPQAVPQNAQPQSPEQDRNGAVVSAAATVAAETAVTEQNGAARSTSLPALGWLRAVAARLGLDVGQGVRATLEEALSSDGRTSTDFTPQERDMLQRILRFGGLRVEDVMVPRVDIICIDESESVSSLLRLFADSEISRIPVYRETLDDPRGMVHVKDLVGWLARQSEPRSGSSSQVELVTAEVPPTPQHTAPLLSLGGVDLSRSVASTKLNRPVLYVPPSMPAVNLLLRMQATHVHLALVVDEHGGTDGLVSIEDLVEQIVGEIEDEHDEDDRHIQTDARQGIIAAARTPIADLERHLGVKIVDDATANEIDTLGGLVFALLGRVPVRGEIIRHPAGLEIEVLDADPRRVKKLRVSRRAVSEAPAETKM
jgi:CBS domain containing-hemolysin-like protein